MRGPWAGRNLIKPDGYSSTGQFADARLVTRALSQMAAAGVQAIVWSGGGEPTLHPEFDGIIAHAQTCGLQQGLYTLGGHIGKSRAEVLGYCLSWVVVSLDAYTDDAYASEKGVPNHRFFDACDGIQRLAEKVPVVGVSFLMHAENFHNAPQMLALSRSLGATYATFRPTVETEQDGATVVDEGREWISVAEPIFRELAKEPDVEIDVDRFLAYRDWISHGYTTCYGVRLLTQVTPDGRVWVCPNRRGIAGSELGDLRTESFSDLWARHPGQWTDFQQCRAMCRLHLVNQTLATVEAERPHAAFI